MYKDVSSGQMVTFTIDDRSFGIDVTRVHEIRGWQPDPSPTQTKSAGAGVLNLHDLLVPIHDLRNAFGVAAASAARRDGVVIVVDVDGKTIGLVADTVSDIVSVEAGEATPSFNLTATVRDLVAKDEDITAFGSPPAPKPADPIAVRG